MAGIDWKALEKRLGRAPLPRERQFVETGGWACPPRESVDVKKPKRPEASSEENRFDARLISWLLAGEIAGVTCQREGVEIWGLWVEGELDLGAMRCERALAALDCAFQEAPVLRDARLTGLYLNGSALPGLNAQMLDCWGNVLLREGFEAEAMVDLAGARIAGQLDCSKGSSQAKSGPALNCNGAVIGGSVFLSGGFHAKGEVDFTRASIGGQLTCRGGTFEAEEGDALCCSGAVIGSTVFLSDGFRAKGEVNLTRASIGGQLTCRGGTFEAEEGDALSCSGAIIGDTVFLNDKFHAKGRINFIRAKITGDLACRSAQIEGTLVCQSARIEAGFFWQAVTGQVDGLDLTEAQVGVLVDDAPSWACVKTPHLSGFCFTSLQSDMTVPERLALLARKYERRIPPALPGQRRMADFDPQPYSHLAKVYEGMGHRHAAARVRFARESGLAEAARRRGHAQLVGDWRSVRLRLMTDARFAKAWVYRVTFGYGHAPFLAAIWTVAIIALSGILAQFTYDAGQMAPASPVVLTSAEWLAAAAQGCPGTAGEGCAMPLRLWEQSLAYRDFETFSAFLYGLDLFLPLDTLGQEEAWAPSKDRGLLGRVLYYSRWAIQLSGWLLIATAAAVLTGVLGKKD